MLALSALREREEQTMMPKAQIAQIDTTPPAADEAAHEAAINAPSHATLIANPEHRARTDAIPASHVGELPGPSGTADIHVNTRGVAARDGDPDPEGWYGGQGGITGDRTRDRVPVSDDMREMKEQRHEPLAGR
jgi:hypothetical protein